MDLSRRQFMALAAAFSTTCATARSTERADSATRPSSSLPASEPAEQVVDAGLLSDFAAPGVHEQFREQGFFVIHRDKRLFVLSAVCTHKGCKVRAQDDQSFLCKCHGSRFDPEGKPTKGPAVRDLPRLVVGLDEQDHVLVNLDRRVTKQR